MITPGCIAPTQQALSLGLVLAAQDIRRFRRGDGDEFQRRFGAVPYHLVVGDAVVGTGSLDQVERGQHTIPKKGKVYNNSYGRLPSR